MDDLHSLRGHLRSKFLNLVKNSASEEKLIEFISSLLKQQQGNKLDIKTLEIILDLTLAVVDQYGYIRFNYFDDQKLPNPTTSNQATSNFVISSAQDVSTETLDENDTHDGTSAGSVPEHSSYDADDEDFDDKFLFPCHIIYDDCHPELLSDYHREHLTPSRTSTQIVKLPKLCEFVIESMFKNLMNYIYSPKTTDLKLSASSSLSLGDLNMIDTNSVDTKCNEDDDDDNPLNGSLNLTNYLDMVVNIIKKLNKACLNETRNCKILSKTGMLSVVMQNLILLIEEIPDKQHIYLEPLLKFVLTLADYRVSGANLKQLFYVIKNENTDLKLVLANLERLLVHHYKILRNIQPSKSINFPTASKTPEEIEYDLYVANSWHWRLRSKIVEYKRKRFRTDSQSTQDLKLIEATQAATKTTQATVPTAATAKTTSSSTDSGIRNDPTQLQDNRVNFNNLVTDAAPAAIKISPTISSLPASRITSSWLECSLMTPLSNISPLLHNGELKFCCSMWISVCGDMLVIEGNKYHQRRKLTAGLGEKFNIDWTQLDGHWLRLTSRRRLVRRHKNKAIIKLKPRKRRLSVKLRRRQAYDKEDEEREEIEEKVRKSDAELSQGGQYGRGRFRLFHSSLSRHTRNSAIKKQRDSLLKKARVDDKKSSASKQRHIGADDMTPPRECLGRRARDNSQELLIHLVSFAIDSLTIEIWLNVKSMTFCARACRVSREGQTNLLDQVTFASHLESNGSWSNIMFCFEENNKSQHSNDEKVMNFKVIVNGVHKEKEKLVYCSHKSPLTNFALLIGCERSTFGYVWKLSQINIYKNIPNKNMPIYLLGKGPDFWTFTNFRQQSLYPLPDLTQRYPKIVLNPKTLMRYSTIDEEQALNWLTQNIMISYVAHQPDHFMDYSPSITASSIINPLPADYEFSNSAERFIQAKTLDFSRQMKFNQNHGFGSALAESGGIESVLICFAEVIRRPNESAQAHALAFSILLKMSQTNLCHLNKFLDELNGLKLIEFILTHPNCKVSRSILENYLDFCLIKRGERNLIKSPQLIYHLMTCWRAWHQDIKVAKLLYRRLIRLLQPPEIGRNFGATTGSATSQRQRDEHKLEAFYISHNFRMMSQAGGIDILMDVLRESLVTADTDNVVASHINHELIEHIVNLISLLIKHPPGLDVMLDIMEFLLFLHPDPKAYVEVSPDRISFLHTIHGVDKDLEVMFDELPSKVLYTPSSRTSQGSQYSSSDEQLRYGTESRDNNGGADANGTGSSESNSTNNDNTGRDAKRRRDKTTTMSAGTSDDELFRSLENRISSQCSKTLAELIEAYNLNHKLPPLSGNEKIAWLQQQDFIRNYSNVPEEQQQQQHQYNYTRFQSGGRAPQADYQQQQQRCSNRNYAIASIADMLASIVKLSSTDPMKILSEALQKPIIDPRKLIILANNDSYLVREKVLRLFFYCIRACYSLDLKSVLSKYELNSKSDNYRICVPIHLMARQLLKYPTTVRMIQLCYGIIVGVDDFETVDTVCLIFDIETINNHLQLNTLVLLMHLLTRLELAQDLHAGLQFVHAYLRQLLQLGEVDTVSALIKNNLIDCIMNLYFNYIEAHIAKARNSATYYNRNVVYDQTNLADNLRNNDDGEKNFDQADQVADELDKLLIFVERFYIQHSPSNEMLKSIEEILLYFDLLNTHVPTKYHHLLRDRKVKILVTLLRYCRHYEDCARQKAYGGKVEYYLKSFFKNNDLNRFNNALPDSELHSLFSNNFEQLSALLKPSQFDGNQRGSRGRDEPEGNGRDSVHLHPNGQPAAAATSSDSGDDLEQDRFSYSGSSEQIGGKNEEREQCDSKDISEADVVERFRATFEFILSFVTTRDPDIIPSPLERAFILKCISILADYLTEYQQGSSATNTSNSNRSREGKSRSTSNGKTSKQTSHWTLLLPTLDCLFRGSFSRLILYLLSPCDAMNIDERKYYAHQLLDMFSVAQLLNMLEENSSRTLHKVLLIFIKDLIDYNQNSGGANSEEAQSSGGSASNSDNDDDENDDDDELEDGDDDELIDDTEIKLRQLVRGLEFEVGLDAGGDDGDSDNDQKDNRSRFSKYVYGKRKRIAAPYGGNKLTKLDMKYRAIWLADLAQAREDSRERVQSMKSEYQASSGIHASSLNAATSLENLIGGGVGGGGSTTTDDNLVERFLDEAISITRDVVNDKHEQRKAYLEDVKQSKIYNYHIRQQWLSLIIGHTHERAIWYLSDFYPKSWELNPVEGPSRTRRRLRPCKFALESRFLRGERKYRQLRHEHEYQHQQQQQQQHRARNRGQLRSAELDSSAFRRSSPLGVSHNSQLNDVTSLSADDWYNQYSPHPLCSLVINNEQNMDSHELRIRMFTTDKIHFNCDCSIVRPDEVCTGEVSIASWCIHFIGERSDNYRRHLSDCENRNRQLRRQQAAASAANKKSSASSAIKSKLSSPRGNYGQHTADNITTYDGEVSTYEEDDDDNSDNDESINNYSTQRQLQQQQHVVASSPTVVEDLWFDEIVEIWDRRYQLQDVGLEIFLTNNMTYLLSFRNNHDREDFKQHLIREQHKMINLQRFNLTTSLTRLTQLWRDGKLTNFDYLTCLNKLAGRSFNDLMQYPVFPFILSNYHSEQLDLTDQGNFRDLRRPMAIQNEKREINFKNNYQMSQSTNLNIGNSLGLSKPYHYGNHYSNSATVLHFLVRLPPFTQMLIQYQDNNFDQPDRTFHSIANTWQLITRDSNTDFKELIPEFFFLPELFTNIGDLELGRKQNNELVDDVRLPAWCPNSDARLFTLIHRQALESAYVSENLHHWIDLIFGYKQTGKAAIDALNVFHPATYYGGIDLSGAGGGNSLSRASQLASGTTDSLSVINLTIATRSAKSSTYGSDYISNVNGTPSLVSNGALTGETLSTMGANSGANSISASNNNSPRRFVLTKHNQADIERSALETMIKTYGQMPRQLFSQPIKQRSASTFVPQINGAQLERQQQENMMMIESGSARRQMFRKKPLEPLRQVKGLRWGSYVGSPEDMDIIAVKHKRIILEDLSSSYRSDIKSSSSSSKKKQNKSGSKLLSKRSDKFHFCLLTNGDVAILRNNTSLMLDYRADRKSSGTTNIYQLSIPSARYSRRAGLSRVSRMNLFSNMIISRQQFSFLEPIYSPANQLNSSFTSSDKSTLASLTGTSQKAKFSLDSLNLVSWFYLDGTIRVKHPAMSNQKPSIPLVQANTIVDTMSTCASVPELNLLLVGYKSGSICAHIVSTSYETAPLPRYIPIISTGASSSAAGATGQSSSLTSASAAAAAPSAVHFLHTTSAHNSHDASLMGPGKVTDKTLTGEPYTALSLAGKTLQSVRSMNKTTRWLYCHSKRINCIKINVSFGIVVTGSDDGTSVIWDLNSLTYVQTIDYKIKSLRMRREEGGGGSSSSGQQSATPTGRGSNLSANSEQNNFTWTYGRANKQKVYDYLCNCNCSSPGTTGSGQCADGRFKFPNNNNNNSNSLRSNASRSSRGADNNADYDDDPSAYTGCNPDIDYGCMMIDMMQQCCICSSGISLIAVSDTLGDIVTIKNVSNRLAAAEGGSDERSFSSMPTVSAADAGASVANGVSSSSSSTMSSSSRSTSTCSNSTDTDPSLTSVIYVHTINGSLVNMVNCHTQVTAVTYSHAPEGISINVIVVGMADGLVRLYNSWDLSRVKEFRVSGLCSPISSILYTRDSQLMYIAYDDGQMVVLRNKKKGSVSVPKEWIL